MAALISSVMNTKDRVPFYVNACHEMGIEVLPPDVNESECDFAVVEGKIRFGLNAVKNVGDSAARAIVAAREEGGPFASIWDFTERVDPQVANKRALEALVKCGALDSTGAPRGGMLAVLDSAAAWGGRHQADRPARPGLDLRPAARRSRSPSTFRSARRVREERAAAAWRRRRSASTSRSIRCTAIRDQLRRKTDCALAEVERRRDGEIVTVGGIVGALKQLTTKKGEPMVFMRLDDLTGRRRSSSSTRSTRHSRELCVMDRILVVKGRVDHKQEGETKLLAIEVAPFEAVAERKEVTIKIDARIARAGVVRDLARCSSRTSPATRA